MEVLYQEIDNGFIALSYDKVLDHYILHIDAAHFKKSDLKRYKNIIETIIKPELRSRGLDYVFGLAETPQAVRFNIFFNSLPTDYVVTDEDGVLNLLMKLETK